MPWGGPQHVKSDPAVGMSRIETHINKDPSVRIVHTVAVILLGVFLVNR